MIQIITALLPLLDKILPDEKAKDAAKLEALKLAQEGQLAEMDAQVKLMLGQIDVNKVEAAQDNFRGGWRPGCGWVCFVGLFYNYLLQPLLAWVSEAQGWPVPPSIDVNELMVLLGGMLGLGGLRSFERINGKI
jgi:hypothetical protein